MALVVALVGMVTGVTSLYITWRSTSEESALKLAAYPTASQNDITPQGLGVRVELVNESLRPIVLRSAQLLLDGDVVSDGNGWIADVGMLEEAASDPSRLTASRRTFPIGLGAREGKSVAIMMDLWTPSSQTNEGAGARTFVQLTAALASLAGTGESERLQLRLDHVPVSAVTVPTSSASDLEHAVLRRAPPQLWEVELRPDRSRLAGITLRRLFAGVDELDLARLDIWNVRTAFHYSDARPVLARQQTFFPLADVARGNYIATVEVRGQLVAYKSFAVPIPHL